MNLEKSLAALQKLATTAAAWMILAAAAIGQTSASFKVLHAFGGPGDGVAPYSGVIFDRYGNLYGETLSGGNTSCPYGCGLVYQLTPEKGVGWVETILYQFTGGNDGYEPNGGLAMDAAGNLYGVAQSGGAYNTGTAFELSPDNGSWREATLYNFCSLPHCADGGVPFHGPILDPQGNLYGTAGDVAYELSLSPSGWTETVLYAFCSQPNCTDGSDPQGLIRDTAGNLYGAAQSGGSADGGVIFTLRPKPGGGWTYHVLYDFTTDGAPDAIDLHDGALYGNTVGCEVSECGTIFDLTASGRKIQANLLYTFTNSANGATPQGNLAFDSAGNLYGATGDGGSGCGVGCGVVFELTPGTGGTWQYQLIHDFDGYDGQLPQYGVIEHGGHLFGTTLGGGAPYYVGVVFEITPQQGPRGWPNLPSPQTR